MNETAFNGFSTATFKFLRDLKANNDRDWFAENKPRYREVVVKPTLDFVLALGRELNELHPEIIYDTRTNGAGSMFRIYRDTRFSKDKTPYKTHVGIFFWLGLSSTKMDNPGIYIHLDDSGAQFHSGLYRFEPGRMKKYRDALANEKSARKLKKIINDLEKKGFEVHGQRYKRVPRGFDKSSEFAELARFKGLYVSCSNFGKNLAKSARLVGDCKKRARQVVAFNNWFAENLYH